MNNQYLMFSIQHYKVYLSLFLIYPDISANCEDGTDYDEDSESCLPCVQGYYRTQGEHDLCQKCPEVAITAGPGATSEEDCNLGKTTCILAL